MIDSHCHLDFPEFDPDRDDIIARCRRSGVRAIIVPGVAQSQWSKAQALSESHDGIFFAAGIHPWWVSQLDEPSNLSTSILDALKQTLEHKKCIAVGECGLEGASDVPMESQQAVFQKHLFIAQQVDKPLIIHSVKAHHLVQAALKKHELKAGGVIHAFSGSYEVAIDYISRGFMLGVGGVIMYDRAKKTRDAIGRIPLESIVLETDAPDMPLAGKQGQRNSPVYIPAIAEALANLRGESVEHIAQQTTKNVRNLFSLPDWVLRA